MVAVLQRGHRMPIFHKVVWFIRVFLKWSQWSCKTTPFLPCQKQLCSQWLVSVHISFHANEHCSPRPSLLWNFLTKHALNCPSFRKQSLVKWFAQPGINEFSEVKWSEVTCGQVWWPILGICALHLTHPSAHTQQWTHTRTHTHTHTVKHTSGAVGSHIAAVPGEQLGVRCLAQGSHLSRGIEGGRER